MRHQGDQGYRQDFGPVSDHRCRQAAVALGSYAAHLLLPEDMTAAQKTWLKTVETVSQYIINHY